MKKAMQAHKGPIPDEKQAAFELLQDHGLRREYDTSRSAAAEIERIRLQSKQNPGKYRSHPNASPGEFKFSIRNPAVALGAAVLAAGSLYAGLQASERVSDAKDKGEKTAPGDKAIKALGISGAAAIIAAAAIMWNAERHTRR